MRRYKYSTAPPASMISDKWVTVRLLVDCWWPLFSVCSVGGGGRVDPPLCVKYCTGLVAVGQSHARPSASHGLIVVLNVPIEYSTGRGLNSHPICRVDKLHAPFVQASRRNGQAMLFSRPASPEVNVLERRIPRSRDKGNSNVLDRDGPWEILVWGLSTSTARTGLAG